jgi:hypothetical protein
MNEQHPKGKEIFKIPTIAGNEINKQQHHTPPVRPTGNSQGGSPGGQGSVKK